MGSVPEGALRDGCTRRVCFSQNQLLGPQFFSASPTRHPILGTLCVTKRRLCSSCSFTHLLSVTFPSRAMAGQASVFINQKGAFLWLMGLTIVFEIIAHLKMWRALEAEEHGAIGSGRLTAEEWCLASSDPASPRCLEAELFRSWQRSTPAWPLAVGDVGLEGTVQDMAARAPNATGSGAVAMEQVSPLGSPLQKIFGLTTQPTTSSSPSRVASAAQGKVTADAHAWSPMTSWAKGLVELQKSLEERFNALPSERLRQAQRRAAEFDRLAEQVSSSLEHSSGDTQWGKDLEALQRRLEEQHASLPSQQTLESKLDREAAKITESL